MVDMAIGFVERLLEISPAQDDNPDSKMTEDGSGGTDDKMGDTSLKIGFDDFF